MPQHPLTVLENPLRYGRNWGVGSTGQRNTNGENMRKVLRVPCIWAEKHLTPFDELIAFTICHALNRHLTIQVFRSKVKMVAAFAEMLQLPDQQVAALFVSARGLRHAFSQAYQGLDHPQGDG